MKYMKYLSLAIAIVCFTAAAFLIGRYSVKKNNNAYHEVFYTFIDTVKKDTSYEGINIDAICDFLVDSSWDGYDRFGFRSLVDMVIRYGNKDTTIYFGSLTDSVFLGNTITLDSSFAKFDSLFTRKSTGHKNIKKRNHETKKQDSHEPQVGCDSTIKALNVSLWKYECERIKHHNEVLPEEAEFMPILSPDSCNVTFPL